jgi:hypothetical protein
MELTPHWREIKQSHADIHTFLQWVTAKIFEQKEITIACTQEFKHELDQAIENDFLKTSNEKITFSSPEIKYDYLVRHATDLLFQKWDDGEDFFNIFNQIQRLRFLDLGHDICASVFLVLNQEYKKDVIGRISEVAVKRIEGETNSLFWDLFHLFCEILPNLEFESRSLADALELMIKASAQDLAGGGIYHAVEKLAARSLVDADVLYNEFLVRSNSPVINLTLYALLGLAKSSLQEAHCRALTLANSETLIFRRIGISALGHFKYCRNDLQLNLLNSSIEKLEAFREIVNPEIDDILAQAYGNLAGQSEEAAKGFIELALTKNLAVKNQVSHILSLKNKEEFNQSWYKETLFNVVQTPLPSLEMIEQLDLCIKCYAEYEPDTVLNIIETLAINWEYHNDREDMDLPAILDTTFLDLYNNHRDVLMKGMTRWFASNNQHLHLAAFKVQQYFSKIPLTTSDDETNEEAVHREIENSLEMTLSKQVLDALDEQEVINLIYRLVGYIIVDAYSLSSLLLSVLRREQHSSTVNSLVTHLLANHVLYNYPGDGRRFFEYFLGLETISELEKEVIQAALKYSDLYFEARKNLPYLKEFKPSSQRLYLLRLAEWKHQSLIMDEARKRSIFSFMTTNIPLKYGRSFSIERDGSFTEPSKLSSFHHEQELPYGELIDPIGQIYQRLKWRTIGLENLQSNSEDNTTGGENL